MSSFIDDHPKPKLLLKRNKLYLTHILKEIKKFGTDFVKNEKYAYYSGHIKIFFELVQRLNPIFTFEKKYVKTFITSFICVENPEIHQINECSLFYQSLTNHVYAFKEYLKSDGNIHQWLPLWCQYTVDFENFREIDLKKLKQETKQNSIENNSVKNDRLVNNTFENVNIPFDIDENNEEDNNVKSPLIDNLEKKIKNVQDKQDNMFMDIQTIMKVKEFGQNIIWERIREDLKNSIQEWNYTWILLYEVVSIFTDFIPNNNEYKYTIEQDLDMHKWREYILKHENKELAFKEYFSIIQEKLDLLGIVEHKNRYLVLNQESNEIISTQSFEKAIPIIFQKIFKEFEILVSHRMIKKKN